MGQTLSHGVYLPAEGERNCYSGLASNWNLLDTAIGDTAGKASATHTHGNITNDGKVGTTANLPLITGTGGVVQAGAFGNQANTFCEGNDSRLSDARTPVAHTHTKADVTDLFNSANTWTGDNTYTAIISYQTSYTLGNPPQISQAQQVIRALDTAGTNYLAQISTYQDTAATGLRFTVRDKFDSNGFSPSGSNRNKYFYFVQNISNQGYLQWDGYANNNIIPLANNSYDLGSSSYQWNNLYAKNYYYNGTEFQSKFVTTDTVQTVNGVKTFTACVASIGSAAGDEYSANARTNLWLMGNRDTEEVSGILFDTYRQNTAQGTGIHILGIGIKENSVRYEGCRWGWYWDNNLNGYTFDFKPTTQGANQAVKHNLGTSTDKWDTINGINPGALSLPDKPGGSGTVNVNYFDLSGNVTVKDGSTYNSYTALCDGWIVIGSFASEISIEDDTTNLATTAVPKSNGYAQAYLPVRQGDTVRITINQTNTQYQNFKLIPCQGNV